jgi:hypothetical protein
MTTGRRPQWEGRAGPGPDNNEINRDNNNQMARTREENNNGDEEEEDNKDMPMAKTDDPAPTSTAAGNCSQGGQRVLQATTTMTWGRE